MIILIKSHKETKSGSIIGNEIWKLISSIIRNSDKCLTAKRAATKKSSPDRWEFISEFADTGETPEETILRETKEELGIEGKIINSSGREKLGEQVK